MQKSAVSAKKRLALIAVFLSAFSVLLVTTNFALYRRARAQLDAQMGERLRAIAVGIAHTVEAAGVDSLGVGSVGDALYANLMRTRDEHTLSNIVIVTEDGHTVVDLAGYSAPGEDNPFIELDLTAVDLARAGVPSYTSLYRTGEVYMKSAYAPVMSPDRTVLGIVGVEAGAAFFSQLRELANLIVLISLGNASVVILLGFLFYRRSLSLDRAQVAMIEKDNLAALGRMTATIAHEIRNPLSIIRSSAERLRRKHNLTDPEIGYITEEVDDLDRTLTGYLQFARAQPAEFAAIPASRVVARALAAIESEATARRVTVRETDTAGDALLRGDERRVRQALLNVLLNAVQAAPEDGSVDVSLERRDGTLRVSVTDDGPGIDRAILREVTRPFFTTRVDGSGLGLTVVRSVMEEHGGTLDIKSGIADGHGTRVTLVFPLSGSGSNTPTEA